MYNTKTCPQYTGLILHQHQMNDLSMVENKIKEKIPNIKDIKQKFMNENREFLLEKIRKMTTITSTTSTTTKIRVTSSKLVNSKLMAFYPKQRQTKKF